MSVHFGTGRSTDSKRNQSKHEKLAKQTNEKPSMQTYELDSVQSNEQQHDKTTSTNVNNDKNSLGAAEDHTGSDNKKAAILDLIEDIAMPERLKASILYVYIIISIDITFVSYNAEINT